MSETDTDKGAHLTEAQVLECKEMVMSAPILGMVKAPPDAQTCAFLKLVRAQPHADPQAPWRAPRHGSYRERMRLYSEHIGYTRALLRLSQSKAALVLPPQRKEGGKWQDPWVAWGDRVMKSSGIRLPGSWRTKRLAKKRRRALWISCGGY